MKTISKIFVFLFMIISLSSCEHKDLCFEHYATLRINFDWVNAPDADPDNMRVYMYRDGASSFSRIADLDPSGGYIRDVSPGTYHILCFNTTETAYERDVDSFVRQALTTSITSLLSPLDMVSYVTVPVATGTEDENPRLATETIWGCSQIDVVVDENGTTIHEVFDDSVDYSTQPTTTEHVITLYPRELSCLYTVEIRNCENVKNINYMSATLSGMASTLNLATGEPSGDSCIIPFLLEKKDDTTVVGEFTNFGVTSLDTNQLVMYVWATDGKGYAYGIEDLDRLNVTNQIDEAEDPHRVHIIIDGFTFPESAGSSSGTGFDVQLDDWDTINQEIPV